MNFSFGSQKVTEGFTLGTPTNTQAATTPGLNFAAGDNKGLSTPQSGQKTQFGLDSSGLGNRLGFQLGATPTNPNTLSGGFSLGGTPTNTTTPLLGTPTSKVATSSAPPNFSLGSTLNAQSSAPTLFSSLAKTTASTLGTPATAAASTPSFNLGSTLGTSTPAASTGFTLGGVSSTPAPATTTTTTFSLGGTPATTTTSIGLTSTASTIATSAAAPAAATTGTFTFGQLEEALNKWTLELEDQGKMFINQALQLNAWDRLVIANGEKILTLNNGIEKVKQQQLQLDHELDFVLAQQRELEECIAPLEKELKDIPITDQDRNHTYQIAENMDTQLKQMSEDLKEIIEHLNESNKTEETNDPVAQIGRILNAHMNSLQWIDRNTAQISTYLDQITKMHDMHRRDNERSFHLTYE